MQSTHYSLPNGLRVILVDTQAFPSLTTLLFIGAGSRYETQKNNGIAHFFEHMAFKGSKKYPSAEEIATVIEGLGGYFNAFTSKDYTGYYVKGPAEDAETVVSVIADMIQQPLLAEEEIQKEKGVIIQEINMYEDTPQRKIFELFEEMMYPHQPLGYDIIGTKETVSSFTQETFHTYMQALYGPHNAVLILAGGLSSNGRAIDHYKRIVEANFAGWAKGTKASYEPAQEDQTAPISQLFYKKSEQAHFCVGMRTFSRFDDKKYVLELLSIILGGGMSSRLFREVREKRGLCYAIKAFTEYFDDAGYMAVYAGVDPTRERAREALRVIMHECSAVVDKGITEVELTRAKEMLKGHLILGLEDTFSVASIFGRKMLFENSVFEMDDILRRIEAVTRDQVSDLAREIFVNNKLNYALIGPMKEDEPLQQIVQKGF